MNDPWGLFAAIAAAHALGVASPGPDWAVVLRQSLAHGRRQGVLTAAGIAMGIVVHTGWAFFGLVQARIAAPAIWPLMQYGGALLLLWLGIRSLTAPSNAPLDPPFEPNTGQTRARSSLIIGLATNLLNPKAALFFLGLGTGVASVDASTALRLTLSLWLVLATFAFFCLLSMIATHPRVRSGLVHHRVTLDKAMGILLILVAIAVILA